MLSDQVPQAVPSATSCPEGGHDRPMNGIFLFAGGGGFYSGFDSAGFKALFAADIEPTAADTFALNAPDVPFVLTDVRLLTAAKVRELVGGQSVDVLVGGPPCQGFSTLGDQLQGDSRNTLFEAFARVLRWTEPRCVVMENTSYVRTQYSGQYEQEIRRVLESLGYLVSVATLNAADYGTAQVRKRAFFVGTRGPARFVWPTKTHAERANSELASYRTVGDAIADLEAVEADGQFPNHLALNHSDKVVARYRLIPEGGRMPPPQMLPEEIRRRNFGNTYKRLHRGRPSLTMVPGNNAFPVHPVLDRSLTPREAARIQGFSDNYVFAGNRAEQCKLVGNAVPVPLAEALAKAVRCNLESSDSPCQAASSDAEVPYQAVLPLGVVATPSRGDRKSALKAVSMFTGIGGLTLGFARCGFEIVASFDKKNHIAENFQLNFPDTPHFTMDLASLSPEELRSMIGGEVDVVFGGPPCQGFSVFGKRRFVNTKGHRLEEDERNDLSLHYLDLAAALNPKVIFFENVKGFGSAKTESSAYLELLIERLRAHGYEASHHVINCADYGVPQARERFILIAVKDGFEFHWPKAKHHRSPKSWQRPHNTVRSAISDLADESTHDAEFSHVPMNHGALMVERLKLIPEGGKLPEAELTDELRRGTRSESVKNYSHVFKRLAPDRPSTTLVPGHNAFPIHPWLNRALTVREAARLQTFPDWMRFRGTRQQQCILVGNAVPPLVGELFAQAIAKTIKGNAKAPGYKADTYELRLAAT